MHTLTLALEAAVVVGLSALLVQAVALRLALRRPPSRPRRTPPFSVLKPLCGLDDALEECSVPG
jgi:hypothetical protein